MELKGERMIRLEYGQKVEDVITGYVGRVTAYCDYYGKETGQYLVEDAGHEVWVSENRLQPLRESEEDE